MVDYNGLKVTELREELKKRSIPTTNLTRKQQIIDRLVEDDGEKQAEPEDPAGTTNQEDVDETTTQEVVHETANHEEVPETTNQGEAREEQTESRFPQPTVPDHPSTTCLLYTSPSPRDGLLSRMPSSA